MIRYGIWKFEPIVECQRPVVGAFADKDGEQSRAAFLTWEAVKEAHAFYVQAWHQVRLGL